MKRSVKLFLAGQEVEFSNVPEILYNYKIDDATEPAVIKNSYSKTISIPGTPNNNRIFGNYENPQNEGTGSGTYFGIGFDPRKRMPFEITIDGEVYETGYARLDNFTQDRGTVVWNLSLFGGLGDFFYNLEYGEDESKRKLSSLVYRTTSADTSSELDLSFTISAGTLYQAWIGNPTAAKWQTINFASCYDGVPNDFSADKVLINYNGINETVSKLGFSAVTSGGTTYVSYNGYALASLPEEFTQAEMREFRSWMQRPILSVRKTIEAICFPENNGGYEVSLDRDFFNSTNPYYYNLYMTLPLLSEISSSEYSSSDAYSVHNFTRAPGGLNYNNYQRIINIVQLDPAVSINDSRIRFNINLVTSAFTGSNGATADTMYTSAYVDEYFGRPSGEGDFETYRSFSSWAVQIVAYAGTNYNSSVLAASEVAWLTSPVGNDYLSFSEIPSGMYKPEKDASYFNVFGNFVKQGNVYKWSTDFSLNIEIPAGAKSYGVILTPLANPVTGTTYGGGTAVGYGSRRRMAYKATQIASVDGNRCSMVPYSSSTETFISGNTWVYGSDGETMGYTGAQISKNMLLDTDYSPCDFLLSYTKLFGLYFIKDPVNKKIQILTRKNFFKRDEIVEFTDRIDRTSMETKPLAFDSKWYKWAVEQVESEAEDDYEKVTGKQYGDHTVNTNYDFNSDTKDIFDNNIFRGGIMATERSPKNYRVGADKSKPWMHIGYSYDLYNPANMESAITIDIQKSVAFNKTAMQEDYPFYDLFARPVFHTEGNSPSDGSNVLLLRNGYKNLTYTSEGATNNFYCYITDDVPEMGVLNENKACWLYTLSEKSKAGTDIAKRIYRVPYYTRAIVNTSNGFIVRTLDFGTPEKIYVPGVQMLDRAGMYPWFWEDYMNDLFSRNSRVLKTKVLFKEKPGIEDLRRFYLIDGTLWRMAAINDWNVAEDRLTTCEFIKVQNAFNYNSITPIGYQTVYLSVEAYSVPQEGSRIPIHIRTIEPVTWTLEVPYPSTSTLGGDTVDRDGYWIIPANTDSSAKTWTLSVYNSSGMDSVTLTQPGV